MGLLTYWGSSSQCIVDEAKKLGYEVKILNKNKNLFIASNDEKTVLFKSTDCGVNSSLGFKIAQDKQLTYQILEQHHLPIAKSLYVSLQEERDLEKIQAEGLTLPIVVKPLTEGHGNGITTNISTQEELEQAFEFVKKYGDDIIIQEHIFGDEYRILVVGDKVSLCINRIPAFVMGDGKSTIKELIEIENKNPDRGAGYHNVLSYIEIDTKLIEYISKNNLTLASIPEKNKIVQLRGVSNAGMGGMVKNELPNLCESIKQDCIRAAKSLGLGIAGVDVITTDITKPLSETRGIIVEVNATPGIAFPESELKGTNAPKDIIELVLVK
ncbi:MAG: hypothetical protein CR971_00780 [candidate division SR1 bacterium]|nr:MAG: hypothetical protein CR971_00780 [candidate division SR1 bacterium]